MKHRLRYTKNHNGKLFLDISGTIRNYCPEKYFVNNELEIDLNGIEIGTAKIVAVRTFEFRLIRDPIAFLDTGHNAVYLCELLRRFYAPKGQLEPDHLLMHVVWQYTKRNLHNQDILLKEWWADKQQLQFEMP